jgi:hypothetical protein
VREVRGRGVLGEAAIVSIAGGGSRLAVQLLIQHNISSFCAGAAVVAGGTWATGCHGGGEAPATSADIWR